MEKSILLIEDNPDDEMLALRAMRKVKIANQVFVARDGAEALALLFESGPGQPRKLPVLPAVILLDLKLPKIDGLEVLHHIRSTPETRMIPVVVLTNSNEEQDILRSYHLGANSYVRKPIDFQTFTQLVSQLGTYWLEINEAPPTVS